MQEINFFSSTGEKVGGKLEIRVGCGQLINKQITDVTTHQADDITTDCSHGNWEVRLPGNGKMEKDVEKRFLQGLETNKYCYYFILLSRIIIKLESCRGSEGLC